MTVYGRFRLIVVLVERFSNPSPSLKSILDVPASEVKPKVRQLQATVEPPKRLGNGVVQRAVIRVLCAANRPLRTGEVQAGVEDLLRRPVAKDSVNWVLHTGSRGEKPRFERVAYATYRLSSAP